MGAWFFRFLPKFVGADDAEVPALFKDGTFVEVAAAVVHGIVYAAAVHAGNVAVVKGDVYKRAWRATGHTNGSPPPVSSCISLAHGPTHLAGSGFLTHNELRTICPLLHKTMTAGL
jgi:hypothetical protein